MTEYFAATTNEPLTLDGETIRKLRKAAGLTQVELASRLDVTPESVANWENGRANPKSAQLAIEIVRKLRPEPEPCDATLLLPPGVFTVTEDRTLAAVKKTGAPPVVYFTKVYDRVTLQSP